MSIGSSKRLRLKEGIRRFCIDQDPLHGSRPLQGTLSRRGLDPINLAYKPNRLDGRLLLNRLGQ